MRGSNPWPFDSVTWTGHVDYDLNRWLTVSRLVKKPFSLRYRNMKHERFSPVADLESGASAARLIRVF